MCLQIKLKLDPFDNTKQVNESEVVGTSKYTGTKIIQIGTTYTRQL